MKAIPRRVVSAITFLVMLVSLFVVGNAANAAAITLGSTATSRTTTIQGSNKLTYWGNGTLGAQNENVTRVLFVIHGNGQNPDSYAQTALDAAKSKGVLGQTLVVTPYWDMNSGSGIMYWDSDWREGDFSKDSTHQSSYLVLDKLINSVDTTTYPNLKEIVVAGHSAGSQFATRWAAISPNTKVTRVVAANAGSHVWLDSSRPYSTSGISGYNDYKYGTANRPSYVSGPSTTTLKAQFAAKRMIQLQGTADTVRDSDFDTSKQADTQGRNRYERGHKFFDSLVRIYGSSITTNHEVRDVPGVAHTWGGMAKSSVGMTALFNG
jgi:pimeloyl-ACP methyl ester carboxylesterase